MECEGRKPRSNSGILFVVAVWVAATWALWVYVLLHHKSELDKKTSAELTKPNTSFQRVPQGTALFK
jgi:hypothetical protein